MIEWLEKGFSNLVGLRVLHDALRKEVCGKLASLRGASERAPRVPLMRFQIMIPLLDPSLNHQSSGHDPSVDKFSQQERFRLCVRAECIRHQFGKVVMNRQTEALHAPLDIPQNCNISGATPYLDRLVVRSRSHRLIKFDPVTVILAVFAGLLRFSTIMGSVHCLHEASNGFESIANKPISARFVCIVEREDLRGRSWYWSAGTRKHMMEGALALSKQLRHGTVPRRLERDYHRCQGISE